MQQPRDFVGSARQQYPLFNPRPLRIPYHPGHTFPIVPVPPAMHPVTIGPPGPPFPPGPQMPPDPGMVPCFQMPPMLHDQMYSGTVGPQVAQDLTRHPAPTAAAVSSRIRRFSVPSEPSIRSGFQVTPTSPAPPSLPGPRNPRSRPGRPKSPHLPELPNKWRKQRKQRMTYTKWQKNLLEAAFKENQYPSYEDCAALAKRIDVSRLQVKIWFKNHRAKLSRLQLQEHSEEPPATTNPGTSAAFAKPGARTEPSSQRRAEKRSSAPASAPTSADAGCPGLSDVSSVPQQSPPGIFPTPPNSSSSVDQDSNGNSSSDQQSVLDQHVPVVAKDGPVPRGAAADATPAGRRSRAGPSGAQGTGPSPRPGATPGGDVTVSTSPGPAPDATPSDDVTVSTSPSPRPGATPGGDVTVSTSPGPAPDTTPSDDVTVSTSPAPAPDATPGDDVTFSTSSLLDAVLLTCQEEGPGRGPAAAADADTAPAADNKEATEQMWADLMEVLDVPLDTDFTTFSPQDTV